MYLSTSWRGPGVISQCSGVRTKHRSGHNASAGSDDLGFAGMIWDWTRIFVDNRQRTAALLILTVVLIFLGLVWFAASGVRGSDQYWYVADVESLIDGRGVRTNEIYPVSVRHNIAALPRPFLHNRLNLYIVALPALLLGAYDAWIVVNVVSSLLTSFLVFCTIARESPGRTPSHWRLPWHTCCCP